MSRITMMLFMWGASFAAWGCDSAITGSGELARPTWSSQPAAGTVITNGSFETGDHSGWFVQQIEDAPPLPIQVAGAGFDRGFGFFTSDPTDGAFATVMSFERRGAGTNSGRLEQNLLVSAAAPIVEFDYRAGWIITPGPGENAPRRFLVRVRNPEPGNRGGGVRKTFLFIKVQGAQTVLDTGDLTGSVDLSEFIGQTINLSFEWESDETDQGPGFFQLDNVRSRAANFPPAADAGPDRTVLVHVPASFDGSGSSDPDGSITSYDWDFGDGASGAGVTAVHTYTTAGQFTATLTVTDDGGLSASDDALVTVQTASDAIEDLKDAVNDLPISDGLKTSLIAKLDAALAALAAGKPATAINLLNAFIQQVEGLRGGALTDAEADFLVGSAVTIIQSIEAGS